VTKAVVKKQQRCAAEQQEGFWEISEENARSNSHSCDDFGLLAGESLVCVRGNLGCQVHD
jgi:hypothetical protein